MKGKSKIKLRIVAEISHEEEFDSVEELIEGMADKLSDLKDISSEWDIERFHPQIFCKDGSIESAPCSE